MGLQATTPTKPPYVWPHIRIHQMKPNSRSSEERQEPPILKISEYKQPGESQAPFVVKQPNNS